MWGSFTHYCAQFLGMNYSERLETVLRDLAQKFGVSEVARHAADSGASDMPISPR